jgi:ubiquinone/menaquinone biosynthesis C-methylase UbiE
MTSDQEQRIALDSNPWLADTIFRPGEARYGMLASPVFVSDVLPELAGSKKILEVGGGYGRNAFAAAEKASIIFNLDISTTALQSLCDFMPLSLENRIIPIKGDARQIPFPAGYLDATYSYYASSAFSKEEAGKILKECFKVTRPGGRAIHNFLTFDDGEYGLGKKLEEDAFLQPDGQIVTFYQSMQEPIKLIENAGFEVYKALHTTENRQMEVRDILSDSWLVFAKKPIEAL